MEMYATIAEFLKATGPYGIVAILGWAFWRVSEKKDKEVKDLFTYAENLSPSLEPEKLEYEENRAGKKTFIKAKVAAGVAEMEVQFAGQKPMPAQKIKIKLKAYEHSTLDRSAFEIVRTAKRTGAEISGPIPLPTVRSLYTVLRSPHVDKKSREQFEMRVHKRLIEITKSTPATLDALTKLDLPAGVDIEIKV